MNQYISSKPRYEILDGLRGVAAIIVLLYHHAEIFGPDPLTRGLNHGYLAVDFFFILSGFVIGYAYDDRWKSAATSTSARMTTWQFFKRRLIRLHPMVIFATFFCAAFFYYAWGDLMPLTQGATPWMVVGAMVCSILMIPMTPGMDIRGWAETNPINGNAWTLYYEYLANILYALVIRHFPKWLLSVFVACTAVLTLDLTLNLDLFGFLANRQHDAYTVVGGWTTNLEQCYVGYVRLLYPFFAGLLISRLMRNNAIDNGTSPDCKYRGFWVTSLFLALVLVMPRFGGSAESGTALPNGIYEAVSILLLFPIIVWMGAKSHVTGRSAKICKWLGDISYPLYITHYGLIFGLLDPWHASHPDATTGQLVILSIGNIALSIFIAHAALKLYDIPVRKWLTDHWIKK